MKKIASPLFQDLSEAELDTLAAARHLRTRQFAKHEVIFRAGSCVREIGIVLRGSVHIENLDLWGTQKHPEQRRCRAGLCRDLRLFAARP